MDQPHGEGLTCTLPVLLSKVHERSDAVATICSDAPPPANSELHFENVTVSKEAEREELRPAPPPKAGAAVGGMLLVALQAEKEEEEREREEQKS